MSVTNLEFAMRTDRGMVRENNEDAVGGDLSAGLVVLADGMGGANAGEVASQLAVEMLINELVVTRAPAARVPEREAIQAAMQRVNRALLDIAQNVPEYRGMGTTVTMGCFQRNRLTFAHIGDSRLYRLRNGVLERLTRDHTLIQELVELGEFESEDEALQAGGSQNILTRAFGSEADVLFDLEDAETRNGDLFLFCSDGLTNMLTDEAIREFLEQSDTSLMDLIDTLIERACLNGGADNISVILARVVDNDDGNNKGTW